MSLITASQFALVRARKSLEKAHLDGDWDAVRHWDTELAKMLDDAFNDELRDTKALIRELENILRSYSKVVSSLPEPFIKGVF